MSINEIKAKMWEVELLGEDLCGLNEVYRDIADEIGIENAVVIYRLFHGTQISFPNRLFSKEYTHKAITKEYNGNNVAEHLLPMTELKPAKLCLMHIPICEICILPVRTATWSFTILRMQLL